MQTQILVMLYNWPTWIIVTSLLAAMLVANELGFRFGRRMNHRETELSRTVSNSLKGSIFGLVALLLAFSFSATTARHDFRQRLVLNQANAVGTCYLRAGLLSDEPRDRIRELLREYVDLRLEHYQNWADAAEHTRTMEAMDHCLNDLWAEVELVQKQNPDELRHSSIVPSANEVIDLSSTRVWANSNHLPNPVLLLLLSGVVISSLLLGHSSGQATQRHIGLWLACNVVFSLVMFVVLDFDRPRRGLIQVDHSPLILLQESIGKPGGSN